jgi:phosphatidate cytidylyltransferase
VSDWRDDEGEDESTRARDETVGEGVRILGADAVGEPAPGRFPLPESGGEAPTWSASSSGYAPQQPAAEPGGSGSMPLPHWSEPPTGEVPKIFADEDAGDEDLDSWASLSGSTPRFRTDAGDWADGDFAEGELAHDDSTAIGALADDHDADDSPAPPSRRRSGRRAPRGRRSAPEPPPPPVDEVPLPPAGDLEGAMPRYEREPERPRARDSAADRQNRVITGLVVGAVALVAFIAGRQATLFLATVVVGVAAFELYEAFRRGGYHLATVVGLLGCVAIVPFAYDQGGDAYPLVMMLVVIFSFLWYLAQVVHARPTVNIALTILAFAYVGVLGGFSGLLLSRPDDGVGWLVGVVLCAVAYDVVAWFVGSQMGRTPLLPRISPNKTLEGLLAGGGAAIVMGFIVGAILHPWADYGAGAGLLLGILVAITAPIGDLAESMMKRDLGLKDLGAILPGHGGVLDRFDAILFALPAAYYLMLHLLST